MNVLVIAVSHCVHHLACCYSSWVQLIWVYFILKSSSDIVAILYSTGCFNLLVMDSVKRIKNCEFLQSSLRLTFLIHDFRWSRLALIFVVFAAISGYIIFETSSDFTRLRSLIGIFSIILVGYVFSCKLINLK